MKKGLFTIVNQRFCIKGASNCLGIKKVYVIIKSRENKVLFVHQPNELQIKVLYGGARPLKGDIMLQANTIEEYIKLQTVEQQSVIAKMRTLIKECAPNATEKISFRMPTYTIGKEVLMHFHTAKNHLGVYPTPEGIEAFASKLTAYKTAKGVVQFPYTNIPYDLIKEIVEHRVGVCGS